MPQHHDENTSEGFAEKSLARYFFRSCNHEVYLESYCRGEIWNWEVCCKSHKLLAITITKSSECIVNYFRRAAVTVTTLK